MVKGLKIAIVDFSYALREEEPNPCNVRLAEIVERAYYELLSEGIMVYVIAQWEVALQLEKYGIPVDHIVQPRTDSYLDSQAVWEEAREYVLGPECINKVVPVCHR